MNKPATDPARFRDPLVTLWAFATTVLVRCPSCARRAVVELSQAGEPRRARLVCRACGHNAVREDGAYGLGGAVDPCFGLPLWLQTPCRGETLWAFNLEHVELLERYLSARLRERARSPESTWVRNKSLVSRLPTWMKLARHRAEVLRGLGELRRLAAVG